MEKNKHLERPGYPQGDKFVVKDRFGRGTILSKPEAAALYVELHKFLMKEKHEMEGTKTL